VNLNLIVPGSVLILAGLMWPWVKKTNLFHLHGDIVIDRLFVAPTEMRFRITFFLFNIIYIMRSVIVGSTYKCRVSPT
jgi:hypothetical protein